MRAFKDGVVYDESHIKGFEKIKAHLKYDGVVRLLEFQELQEARESSKKIKQTSKNCNLYLIGCAFNKHYCSLIQMIMDIGQAGNCFIEEWILN
ncbi:MAG: hypothetical protein JKY54_08255 [Flavobacteriales bacterium]|nr:hypothetical protein [Flavobacteriales bacterium]